jgi:mono/diheme cytochrome c family protein
MTIFRRSTLATLGLKQPGRLPMLSSMLLIAIEVLATGAQATGIDTNDQVAKGHKLALQICSACHVAALDQVKPPILRNPAPSLQSIANRPTTSATSVQNFLLTIHLSVANGTDMPNPELTEDQARDLAAYVMSLRKAKE